jgi:hypothetical protein
VSPILPAVSDFAVPLPFPDVATALEEARARRHAAGERVFQFGLPLTKLPPAANQHVGS